MKKLSFLLAVGLAACGIPNLENSEHGLAVTVDIDGTMYECTPMDLPDDPEPMPDGGSAGEWIIDGTNPIYCGWSNFGAECPSGTECEDRHLPNFLAAVCVTEDTGEIVRPTPVAVPPPPPATDAAPPAPDAKVFIPCEDNSDCPDGDLCFDAGFGFRYCR